LGYAKERPYSVRFWTDALDRFDKHFGKEGKTWIKSSDDSNSLAIVDASVWPSVLARVGEGPLQIFAKQPPAQ